MANAGFMYSHNKPTMLQQPIDPIVFPNMEGTDDHNDEDHEPPHSGPHLHDFGGRVGVTPSSVPSDLYDAPSSGPEKHGGTYWVPSLFIDDLHIVPNDFSARYGRGVAGDKNPNRIIPFPEEFGVVAGRTKQTVSWNVDKPVRPNVASFDTVPVIAGRDTICKITFPDLWDGVIPDGPNWTSHTAYSKNGVCPDGWWVIPQLQLKIHYGKHLPIGEARLSSGPPSSMHADFFNTWSPDRLRSLVDYCIKGCRNCGESGTGPQPTLDDPDES